MIKKPMVFLNNKKTQMPTKQKLTKSRQRVIDYGEVFTAEREVNAMLDLVDHETRRIDSKFLEPTCGDGNFLAEILLRKLNEVKKKYRKNPSDFERNSVVAVSSLYGVEIIPENAINCRERLFKIWNNKYQESCGKYINHKCRGAVKFILEINILCGDALSMKTEDGNPIIFSEWSMLNNTQIKRREFRLDKLLENQDEEILRKQESIFNPIPAIPRQLNFSDAFGNWNYDADSEAYYRDSQFPYTEYWRVQDHE